jgi:hypothetical protein
MQAREALFRPSREASSGVRMCSWITMRTPLTNLLIRRASFFLLTVAVALALSHRAAACSLTATVITTPNAGSTTRPTLRSTLAQDSDSNDETGVSPDQLEKYVAVYRAMQHDRGLTAESAAAKQSLTLGQFRELEQKIERDDVAREQVREELQKAAPAGPVAAPANN